MNRFTCATLAALTALTSAAATRTELFNGKDLSGWTAFLDFGTTGGYTAAEPTWFVADGEIRTTGTPFGYLKTKRADFRAFKLHVEYRWWRQTPKPNSGVFVGLTSETGAFLPVCYENQLCLGSAGDLLGLAGKRIPGREPRNAYTPENPLSGITKSLKRAPSSERPFGEWNVLEVEWRDGTLVNRVNGVEQSRVSNLPCRPGALALQAEGGAAAFRNVWIEE